MRMESFEFAQSQLQVGVARGDITPPVGIYHRMWGAARHDRSTGVHRPLTATALYLAPADTPAGATSSRVALAVDHCLLWPREMQSLLDAVSQQAQVDRAALAVFFSHTHGAGLMGLERCDLPGGDLIPAYLDDLGSRLAGLVREARGAARRATINYGSGRCALAANRDYFDADRGAYVCGFNPHGRADDTVLVGRITAADGSLLGTLVNYACHPTTLAWDNTLISPDFPGGMREVVEHATGVPCFFIQGASGDVGPREGFVGDPATADRNGRQLGYAALAALESLPPPGQCYAYTGPVVSGATIGTWAYRPISAERAATTRTWGTQCVRVALPYRKDLPRPEDITAELERCRHEERAAQEAGDERRAGEARAMVERAVRRMTRFGQLPPGTIFPLEVDVWRLGDGIWVPLNGEYYNVLQRQLRAAFPERPIVVGTLVNGSQVWYVPDAASYGYGLYQEEVSILARGSLEQLAEALQEAIRQLLGSP